MTVRIASRVLSEIRADCLARAPEEACGLLLGAADRIDLALAAPNLADDRLRRFEIDPAVLFAAHRAARSGGPEILGCYHSHPEGAFLPSATDAVRALDLGWIWLIVGIDAERAYRVTENGRIQGRFDEISLLED